MHCPAEENRRKLFTDTRLHTFGRILLAQIEFTLFTISFSQTQTIVPYYFVRRTFI